MSESGEGLPQPEKELSQEELKRAVVELNEQFKAQFENSLIKRHGKPQEIPSGDPFSPFAHHDDPRILAFGPTDRGLFVPKDTQWWKVDQSIENGPQIIRSNEAGLYDTITIQIGEHPSASYELEDKREGSKIHKKLSTNDISQAPYVINKAKEIIADIPQVKN